MSSSTPASNKGSGLSLYADLLDPSTETTPASVSKGPVMFKNPGAPPDVEALVKKPAVDASSLRFQPTKRPHLPQKSKPKITAFPKATPIDIECMNIAPAAVNNAARPVVKSTLADWTAIGDDDDVNGFYGGEKRQRGGRKRRKKQKEEHVVIQDWDDIYDPTRPNSYDEYNHSDERIREVREWKDRLYAHRMKRKDSREVDSDEEGYRPQMNAQFAPPSNFSFAPPPASTPPLPPPPPPADAYAEEDHYSPKLESHTSSPPPTPLGIQQSSSLSAASILPAPTISRAPVRYNLPAAPSELPVSEAELEKALAAEPEDEEQTPEANEVVERSLRPGQKGFAERLMSKYGWSKGKGLGADGSGILDPLRVQIEKRKKKSDAEGGGFREPGGRGKIIGGKKKNTAEEDDVGKFGIMSEVIVLRGMVDGMDLDEEVGDGGLMQEIGEECGDKYGRVERVYIDRRDGQSAKVFVKFTSQLSALRAVNALEGRIFNGNTISALFYDEEKFEQEL